MKFFLCVLMLSPFFVWSHEKSVADHVESFKNISFAEQAAYYSMSAEIENFAFELNVYKKNCGNAKHVALVEKQYRELLSSARALNPWHVYFDESFSKKGIKNSYEKYVLGIVKMLDLLTVRVPQKNLPVSKFSVLKSSLYDVVAERKVSEIKLAQYRKELEELEKGLSLKALQSFHLLPDGNSLVWLDTRIESTRYFQKQFFEFNRLLEEKSCNFETIFRKHHFASNKVERWGLRFNTENLMSSILNLQIEMARHRINLAQARKEIWDFIENVKVEKNPSPCNENVPTLEGAAFLLPIVGLTEYENHPINALSVISKKAFKIQDSGLNQLPYDLFFGVCNRLETLLPLEKKLKDKESLSKSDREIVDTSRESNKNWEEEKGRYIKRLYMTLESHVKLNVLLKEDSFRHETKAKLTQQLKEDGRYSEARLSIVMGQYDVFVKEFSEIIERERKWIYSFEQQLNEMSKKTSEVLALAK